MLTWWLVLHQDQGTSNETSHGTFVLMLFLFASTTSHVGAALTVSFGRSSVTSAYPVHGCKNKIHTSPYYDQ